MLLTSFNSTVEAKSFAIVVTVRQDKKAPKPVSELVSRPLRFHGEKQLTALENANYVIAQQGNEVLEVFKNLETFRRSDGDYVEFTLGAYSPLAALKGHLLPVSIQWKRGDLTSWKVLEHDELEEFSQKAQSLIKNIGPFQLRLSHDFNLEVTAPPGYSVQVKAEGKRPKSATMVKPAVDALALTPYVTTYSTLAKALGYMDRRGAQTVSNLITNNDDISTANGARILKKEWLNSNNEARVPADKMRVTDGETRNRPQLLAAQGLATLIDDSTAVVHPNTIILDPLTLLSYLNN